MGTTFHAYSSSYSRNLGGLVSLFFGFAGVALGGAGGSSLLQLISIAVPIVALIGAGMVMAKPVIGAGLMAAAALAFLLILGFNGATLIPVALLAVAAIVGFIGQNEIATVST